MVANDSANCALNDESPVVLAEIDEGAVVPEGGTKFFVEGWGSRFVPAGAIARMSCPAPRSSTGRDGWFMTAGTSSGRGGVKSGTPDTIGEPSSRVPRSDEIGPGKLVSAVGHAGRAASADGSDEGEACAKAADAGEAASDCWGREIAGNSLSESFTATAIEAPSELTPESLMMTSQRVEGFGSTATSAGESSEGPVCAAGGEADLDSTGRTIPGKSPTGRSTKSVISVLSEPTPSSLMATSPKVEKMGTVGIVAATAFARPGTPPATS